MNSRAVVLRLVRILMVLEVSYLVLGNLVLSLPATQTLANQIRPDRILVNWDRAWTWYPFRVHARSVSLSGQSRSQQWQLDMPAASASFAVLPLILRTVKVTNVQAVDVSYSQRPRLRPDKDLTAELAYFPPIRGRSISSADSAPRIKRKPWRIVLDGVRVNGNHNIWIYQFKGAAEGELQADLGYQTQGGAFSARNGQVDLRVASLFVNGDQEVISQADFKGQIAVTPMVFRQNRGLKSIPFFVANMRVDADVGDLQFLDLFLQDFHGIKVDGEGKVGGLLRVDRGRLLPGTELAVSASELSIGLMSHRAEGNGSIQLDVDQEKPDVLNLSIQFDELNAYHEDDAEPLFSGEGLVLSGAGRATLPSADASERKASTLSLSVPMVRVPDLALYQRYIPQKWQFRLNGGEGELKAAAELTEDDFHAQLKLGSEGAHVGIGDYRFSSDLQAGLIVHTPSFSKAVVDVSGSYIRLDGASVASGNRVEPASTDVSLIISKGQLQLNLPELSEERVSFKGFPRLLDRYDMETLLSAADAEVDIDGSMSDLQWISILFKNNHNISVRGGGKLAVHGLLESGWLAPGTLAEISAENLELDFLDYLARGNGRIELQVSKGGARPDVEIDLDVFDAALKRGESEKAFIEEVKVKLDALGRNMSYQGPGDELKIRVQIPTAKVTDMSIFNQYFPQNSPLQLLGGTAALSANIELEPLTAGGFVKLNARQLNARLDAQHITADLAMDIELKDGVPRDLDFDISGSTVLLDRVEVDGKQSSFDQSDWNIRFDLKKGRIVWNKPVWLQAQTEMLMEDTRPVVAMLANQREKHGWLEKLLTLDNVVGSASFSLANGEFVISNAFASSEKIDIGGKGIVHAEGNEGLLFARYRKLSGLMKISDGKRSFHVLNARKKFDAYQPTAPGIAGTR